MGKRPSSAPASARSEAKIQTGAQLDAAAEKTTIIDAALDRPKIADQRQINLSLVAMKATPRPGIFVSPDRRTAHTGAGADDSPSFGAAETFASPVDAEGLSELSSPSRGTEASSDGDDYSSASEVLRRPIGFTPYTPQRPNESVSIIPLPSAEQYNVAEILVGRSLLVRAERAINEGDLESLQQLVLDHSYLKQMELDLAKANIEVTEELKEVEAELSLVGSVCEVLESFPKTSADYIEKLNDFIVSEPSRRPVKIRTLSRTNFVFTEVMNHIQEKASVHFSDELTKYFPKLSAVDRAERIANFRHSLSHLLILHERLPSYYADLLAGGSHLLAHFNKTAEGLREDLAKLEHDHPELPLLEQSLLAQKIKWYGAALQAKADLVEDQDHLNAVNESLSAYSVMLTSSGSSEDSFAIKSQLITFSALRDAIQLRIRILDAITSTESQSSLGELPLTLKELRDFLPALVDSAINNAYENYKVYCDAQGKILGPDLKWILIDRSNLVSFAAEFRIKISKRLMPYKHRFLGLTLKEDSTPKQIVAVVDRELAAARKRFGRLDQRKTEILDRLAVSSAPLKDELAKWESSKKARLELLLGHKYSDYLRDKAAHEAKASGNPFTRDEEVVIYYRSDESAGRLRVDRLKIMLTEGLSPNAANARKETLLFTVLKAEVARETKLAMVRHLVNQGASAVVTDSYGCEPGTLVSHDLEMQAFLSDVCILQERDRAFFDRVLELAENITAHVDRYQIAQRTRVQSILYRLFMHNDKTLAMREEEKAQYREIMAIIKKNRYEIEALIKQVLTVYDQAYRGPLRRSDLHAGPKRHVTNFKAVDVVRDTLNSTGVERIKYSQRIFNQLAASCRARDEEVRKRDAQNGRLVKEMADMREEMRKMKEEMAKFSATMPRP